MLSSIYIYWVCNELLNQKAAPSNLPAKEFDSIIEELEELEDIKLYDKAKKENTDERILFSDYLKKRKTKNA